MDPKQFLSGQCQSTMAEIRKQLAGILADMDDEEQMALLMVAWKEAQSGDDYRCCLGMLAIMGYAEVMSSRGKREVAEAN